MRLRRNWRRSEQSEVTIVHSLLSRVGENGPSIVNERKGVTGKGEGVLVRIKEEGEAMILVGDVVDIGGVSKDLENSVPITVVIIDPRFAG